MPLSGVQFGHFKHSEITKHSNFDLIFHLSFDIDILISKIEKIQWYMQSTKYIKKSMNTTERILKNSAVVFRRLCHIVTDHHMDDHRREGQDGRSAGHGLLGMSITGPVESSITEAKQCIRHASFKYKKKIP